MLRDLIRSFRVKQWIKNGFLFAGLIFDGQLFSVSAVLQTLLGFIIFNFITSAVYLVNDVFDIASDRQHPHKKDRPIASGKVSPRKAIIIAAVMVFLSLLAGFLLSRSFFLICAAYFLVNLMYSKWLKHVPILDVLIIALGFVLRVAAGVSLITVKQFSPWLYVVTTLLALYLGFGKRRAEMVLFADNTKMGRAVLDGYTLPFLDQLITIVSSATIVAYSLYTFSATSLPQGYSMMLTIPFVMYGIFRYLYLVQVKQSGGAPEEILLQDLPLQITVALYAVCVIIVFYLR